MQQFLTAESLCMFHKVVPDLKFNEQILKLAHVTTWLRPWSAIMSDPVSKRSRPPSGKFKIIKMEQSRVFLTYFKRFNLFYFRHYSFQGKNSDAKTCRFVGFQTFLTAVEKYLRMKFFREKRHKWFFVLSWNLQEASKSCKNVDPF